jgi:hypothetical protein
MQLERIMTTPVRPPLHADEALIKTFRPMPSEYQGRISLLTATEAEVILNNDLTVEQAVQVWLSTDVKINGLVVSCKAQHSSYVARVRFLSSPGDGRREPRFSTTGELVTITVLDKPTWGSYQARLVDVSKGGLGLRSRQRIPVGTWIKVDLPSMVVFGEVVHCKCESACEYRIGVASDSVLSRSDSHPASAASLVTHWIRQMRGAWGRYRSTEQISD